jgi:hypothetical protein
MDYNTINQKIKRLFYMPRKKAIRKVSRKIGELLYYKINEKINIKSCNHLEDRLKISYSYIDSSKFDLSISNIEQAEFFCDMYLNHYFDLLGSGLIKVDYNINPLGIEGIKYNMTPKITEFDMEGEWLKNILLPSDIRYAKNVWKKIGKGYIPIDWQIDFKSGFRYSTKIYHKKQPIGKPRGTDIKVPWEISRMQHLPQLGIFSILLPDKRDMIIREYKNEVYDFASTNPISMGVNWTCTMDVGIRAANMLIAYDILKDMDKNNLFDHDFKKFLSNFIFEHGVFIINNLEWNDGDTNNHYLSNICSLLFISAYLERNETVDSWLAFSIQEIINCMYRQFFDDGGNFEGSTSYHRLSSELMVYTTALIYGLLTTDKIEALKKYDTKIVKRLLPPSMQKYDLNDKYFFPNWYIDKLFKAGLFTMDITKQNGKIPQIGDNDSGRFFKFSFIGEFLSVDSLINKYKNLEAFKEREEYNKYFDEDILNHSTLISALSGIFDYDGFKVFLHKYPFEKSVIEMLSKGVKFYKKYSENRIEVVSDNLNLRYKNQSLINFKDYGEGQLNIKNLRFIIYPYFGLYIFKENNLYLSIYAGQNGEYGNGCHSHNDKLSFELNLYGKDIFFDPGTYLYTPVPEMRDKFRSVKSHNAVIVDNLEQNEFISLSSMENRTKCSIIDYGMNSIKLKLTYKKVIVIRKFIIKKDCLIIEDECNKEFTSNFYNNDYANGYGKLVKLYKVI